MGVITLVLGAAFAMMAVERLLPGRNWPRVRGWWLRAFLLNGFQAVCVLVGSATWNRWMNGYHLLDGDRWGPVEGALLGYLSMTFVYYWWHRWRHESAFLWRWFHQIHHSAQRIEVITSFYKHPFEIFGERPALECSPVYSPWAWGRGGHRSRRVERPC